MQDQDQNACILSKQEVTGLIGGNSWRAGFIVNNALLAKSLELVEFSELQKLINKTIDCG